MGQGNILGRDFMQKAVQCLGFQAAAVEAGIKKADILDLGLIYSETPASVAGLFARNKVLAAPVLLSKQRVASGLTRAVVANAGNANCCTGAQGMADAGAMTAQVASLLGLDPQEVLVASTGVIGKPMPMEVVRPAISRLVTGLAAQGFERFSRAIMTTDTVPKLARRQGTLNNRPFSLVAAAKGAGMIRPDLATLLCFICTDAAIESRHLQSMLTRSVDSTLNRLTIDGDTSTNDTVLIMANGAAGIFLETTEQMNQFQTLLDDLLADLAQQLVRDGEGVTKLVELQVRGAASDQEARKIADAIAHSPLVKTAFFGEDANWGRILAAAGRAGARLDPDRAELFFNEVRMVENGMGCGPEAEADATAVMKQPQFKVTLDLHQGNGRTTLLTCDFSVNYVRINADYRT
jgi:glutamate N-acetyltransferase/amino-acid N-acetyltransferase